MNDEKYIEMKKSEEMESEKPKKHMETKSLIIGVVFVFIIAAILYYTILINPHILIHIFSLVVL